MQDIILFHHDEIGLKGRNQKRFIEKLCQNLKYKIKKYKISGIVRHVFHRYSIRPDHPLTKKNQTHWKKILSTTPGIKNFSFGLIVETHENHEENLEKGTIQAVKNYQENFGDFHTFRISARRAEKNFPKNSQEIARFLGGVVLKNFENKKVKMRDAEAEIFVEVLGKRTYITINKHKALGGLPIGSTGKVLVLLSGGIDSPVAAAQIQKRGVQTDFIHFHSYPQTSKKSIEKVRALATALTDYHPEYQLHMCPFLDTQKVILKNIPDKFRIILYRRFMLRIAHKLAQEKGYQALITGESLGQVASQTLENMGAIQSVIPSEFPILKPLIALDKSEIIEIAKRIGTFEISTRPHEDCCTVYMPKDPETKAKLPEVLEQEEKLNIEKLVETAYQKIEVEKIPQIK